MATEREQPYGGFRFLVSVEGITIPGHAGFSEVSGLDVEIEPIEYRAGNDPDLSRRKIPGLRKYGDVTLKRGVTGSLEFWEWMAQIATESVAARRTVTIQLLDDASNAAYTWKLHNAWPTRYVGPTLEGNASAVAIEVLELAHEGLDIE